MALFTFCDLFAGIGGLRLAFEEFDGKCVFSSEIDKFARQTYEANFKDCPNGDIRKIDKESIPNHTILLAGFPCQPFSLAGLSKRNSLGRAHGFSDDEKGTLFFEIAKILALKKPRAFLLENVPYLKKHDGGKTFKKIIEVLTEELGYSVYSKVINSRIRVPQNRRRLYIVGFDENYGFTFPDIENQFPKLKDILESEVDPKYTISDKLWKYLRDYSEKHQRKGNGFGYNLADLNGIARTLSARYYKDGAEILIPQKKNENPRRLTPRECALLMGFPHKYKIVVSDTQAYKQFGNTVVVPIVKEIARNMVQCLEKN